MHPERAKVAAVASRLAEQLGEAPDLAIVLGSGLGPVVERAEVQASADFESLGLPGSTVPGHAGRLVRANLFGRDVVFLSGRIHLYEGHPPATIVRYVRALHEWGVGKLILTASVGGITEGLVPGALVLVSDHLNLQGVSPLSGPAYATRFPDMSFAYHGPTRQILREAAERADVRLHEGVYAATPGPAYETPAEVRFLRLIGADVVGMSTVPEILAAAELGMPAAAIAVVSNLAAGLSDGPLSHDEVTDAAGDAALGLARIFEEALRAL